MGPQTPPASREGQAKPREETAVPVARGVQRLPETPGEKTGLSAPTRRPAHARSVRVPPAFLGSAVAPEVGAGAGAVAMRAGSAVRLVP